MLAFSAEALRLCAESSAQAHCRPALDNAPELGNGCSWCAGGVCGVPRACSRRPATTWHSVPLELPGLLLKTNRRTLLKHGFIFNIWPGTPGVVVEHSSASDNGRATVLPRLSVSSKPGTCPRGESIRRVINQGRHFLLGHLAGGGGESAPWGLAEALPEKKPQLQQPGAAQKSKPPSAPTAWNRCEVWILYGEMGHRSTNSQREISSAKHHEKAVKIDTGLWENRKQLGGQRK